MLEEAIPPQPQLVDNRRREDVGVGDADVLRPRAVATRIEAEDRRDIVRLRVEHVAAVKTVLVAEAVIDTADVLILVDRRRSAGAAEVDGRLVRVGGRYEGEKLARVILDTALGNDVVRKRLAGLRIENPDGGAGEIAGTVGRGRHKRRSTERTRNLTARLPVEEEEGAVPAVVDLRDRDGAADVGAELVA